MPSTRRFQNSDAIIWPNPNPPVADGLLADLGPGLMHRVSTFRSERGYRTQGIRGNEAYWVHLIPTVPPTGKPSTWVTCTSALHVPR